MSGRRPSCAGSILGLYLRDILAAWTSLKGLSGPPEGWPQSGMQVVYLTRGGHPRDVGKRSGGVPRAVCDADGTSGQRGAIRPHVGRATIHDGATAEQNLAFCRLDGCRCRALGPEKRRPGAEGVGAVPPSRCVELCRASHLDERRAARGARVKRREVLAAAPVGSSQRRKRQGSVVGVK